MSEARRLPLVALVAVLGSSAAPSALGAQDTTLAHLRRRADSLAAEWRRANSVADVADSLQRERAAAGRDTIAVGALRIVVNPSPLPVRAAAARAWPVIDSLFGATARDLAARPYLIRAFDPDTAARRAPVQAGMDLPWDMSVERLTDVLLANVPMPPPDTALRRWLGGPIVPPRRPEDGHSRVYVRLVTAPSGAARDCFTGDLEACAAALDLDAAAEPFLRWYPSTLERRTLVTRAFGEYFGRGASAPTLRACAVGDDASCIELLRSLSREAIPKPLGSDARATFLHTALRLGGRAAYGRLLARTDAPPGARLAAAAALPRDSLLSRWRSDILAARPATVALPGSAAWMAAGWIAFFAACGLRSSRWRLS